MRFVDLFAGLGGFHIALKRLGHKCVFASEIDPTLQQLYQQNHGMIPAGDIRKIKASQVPTHEILCAGFPCQPFSKAGEQEGLRCPDQGDLLFRAVMRIIRAHQPKYIVMENVANLERHDGGRTWQLRLRRRLVEAGYNVEAKCLSPHQFGIPQARERFFIVGSRADMSAFAWPEPVQDWFRTTLLASTAHLREQSLQRSGDLQRQLDDVRRQQDRLLNLHLSGGIDDAQFGSKNTELRDRSATLALALKSVDRTSAEKADAALKVFELSQSLPKTWLKADYSGKRRIIEMVCLNLVLNGTSLSVATRKPFNALVEGLKISESGEGGIDQPLSAFLHK